MQRPLYRQLVPYYEVLEDRDWHREVKLIVSILRRHRLSTVVDLGCGSGYHVRKLAKLGFCATGVDISAQNIRLARRTATRERAHCRFLVRSYYHYRPRKNFDAALFLNWSIPIKNAEIMRFLLNTRSMLRIRGLLILDYERVSDIVWRDVGKPIVNSWDLKEHVVVRVSVGQMLSKVLSSRDVYILYPKAIRAKIPNEKSRYRAVTDRNFAQIRFDRSDVRFFRVPELRQRAIRAGFRMIANYVLPRNRYKRNYAVLERIV